mmetsp:Transcript_21558/g.67627  ORF Transcript_21558/g.67627 Transcript_21558/m.67627 type:complete len:187 (+) Transcript_21558:213-773(+)
MGSVRYALGGEYNDSYCKFLQHAPPEVGIEAEFLRSLHVSDGIGNMIQVAEALRAAGKRVNVVEACMADISPLSNVDYVRNCANLIGRLPVDNRTAGKMLDATHNRISSHSNRLGSSVDELFIMRSFWAVAASVVTRRIEDKALRASVEAMVRSCGSEYCAMGAKDVLRGPFETCSPWLHKRVPGV